ncbi:MAG TPA: LamG domain-containing protein [Chitinophagaceae bacterium]|nr:LamG domain-containing protein [Chitinophagaceae bacterium]
MGLAIALAASCNKTDKPPLGDFPQDANPPGGPLKFYAAYDGGDVDSIRANFGTDNKITYVDGISGKAMSGDAGSYVVYGSANDFKLQKSFTVAFWMKKNGPNAAGKGTSFAFGLSTNTDIWTRQDMFLEFEDAGNPSTADSAAAKFYVNDQWFEFVNNTNDKLYKRLPKVLNGQWHHLAFTFDQTSATLTTYIDGAAYTNLPANFGKFTNNSGKVNLTNAAGIVVGGPGHFAVGKTPDDWMGNFGGAIDQFRLYGVALTAAEVNELFVNKK